MSRGSLIPRYPIYARAVCRLIRVLIDMSNSVVFFYAGVFLVRNGVDNFTLHEISVGLLLWVTINFLRYVSEPWLVSCCCCCGILCRPSAVGDYQLPQVRQRALVGELLLSLWDSLWAFCCG